MKSGRAYIGIFQKMRIKNLRGSVRSDLKKLDSFTLKTSKTTSSATFCATGEVLSKFKTHSINFEPSKSNTYEKFDKNNGKKICLSSGNISMRAENF